MRRASSGGRSSSALGCRHSPPSVAAAYALAEPAHLKPGLPPRTGLLALKLRGAAACRARGAARRAPAGCSGTGQNLRSRKRLVSRADSLDAPRRKACIADKKATFSTVLPTESKDIQSQFCSIAARPKSCLLENSTNSLHLRNLAAPAGMLALSLAISAALRLPTSACAATMSPATATSSGEAFLMHLLL